MAQEKKSVDIHIRIEPTLRDKLYKLAQEDDRSAAGLLRKLVKKEWKKHLKQKKMEKLTASHFESLEK